jgi:hypothetical protein
MRLEFRILWFENQPDDVRTQIEEIEEHIHEAGFISRIHTETDGRNLAALSRQQTLYDDFDLVVVDYDLGDPQNNGDKVAKMVRRGFGFTDIIFYSGHNTVDLRTLVHQNNIDGVYCIERTNLSERLSVHIDQTVRRLSRLEAMRGLSMSTVGKCDDELRALLRAAFLMAEPKTQEEIRSTLDALVENGAAAARDTYAACQDFHACLSSRAVTSFHLQKLALKILKGNPICEEHRELLGRYNEEVLTPRNTLGHAIETRGSHGWEVAIHGTLAITRADFPRLRRNMARHLANICGIRPLLDADGSH